MNALFARKIFGSVSNAVGGHFKMEDGTRVEVVGVAEDGKYYQLTEDPRATMFLPFLQSPSGTMCLVVRSEKTSSWRRRSAAPCESSIPVFHSR